MTVTRGAITASSAAFRYKWLMYGEDPDDTTGTPAILNIFEQSADSATWFTETDRDLVRTQIQVLTEALAYDPLNRRLQSALLDLHYDWAVAEMQFARTKLVEISTKRLGLTTVSAFIIDEEIEAYQELIALTKAAIQVYDDLLSLEMDGIDPGDFDPRYGMGPEATFTGAPFGYFIFQNEVPLRNQTPTQYAPQDNSVVTNVIEPGDSNTFSGFKDYRTLLTILGQYIQYQADLARLRGMRPCWPMTSRLPAKDWKKLQEAATTACVFNQIFNAFDFGDPQFDATGIRAAKTLVNTALNDSLGVRSLVNGTSNLLGLDPNFLLLVPPQPNNVNNPAAGGLFDSYDVLHAQLTKVSSGLPIGPLAIALDLLGDPTNPGSGGWRHPSLPNFSRVRRSSVHRAWCS